MNYNKEIPEPDMVFVVFCENTKITLAGTETMVNKRTVLNFAVAVDIISMISVIFYLCLVQFATRDFA